MQVNTHESQTAKEIKGIVQDLCDISGYGINSGTRCGPKLDAFVDYIHNKLHAAGQTDAVLEPIKVNNPFPEKYHVSVEIGGNPTDLTEKCFPLHWTAGTPPQGITGNLVYLGDGSKSSFEQTDVAGKIVLIDEKMARGYIATAKEACIEAKNRGAIAILRANLQVDSPQQQKGEGTPDNLFPIPVFCFGKSGGDYLRELILSEIKHLVKIELDVPHNVYDTYNISLELKGNGNSNEVILIGTHYDTGHFTGTVDNNASIALMIKWAEYFSNIPVQSRNRDLIFAWCCAHDFDMNSGHYQFAAAHKEQLKKAIVWDVDHAIGGTRYVYDEAKGEIVPVSGETCVFYIISNNYTFSRLASFVMDKYGFCCNHNRFGSSARGPQWGMAPDTSPWVSVASIPIYYHSIFDTPDKITIDHIQRAYSANIEIIENISKLPDGFLFYDNISRTRPNTPPKVKIAVLSDTVKAGDMVWAWNDETAFYDDRSYYHYPALPEWAGTIWEWGDGAVSVGGTERAEGPLQSQADYATHVYQQPGNYTVTMKCTDVDGATTIASKTIRVLPFP